MADFVLQQHLFGEFSFHFAAFREPIPLFSSPRSGKMISWNAQISDQNDLSDITGTGHEEITFFVFLKIASAPENDVLSG